MLTWIEDVHVHDPEDRGICSLLFVGERVAQVGGVRGDALLGTGLPLARVDGSRLRAIPGLVDAHEHLVGGSGELGFHSQTPEITVDELLRGGITSVVGCLGVDTTTRTMPALLAKAKGLRAEGFGAFVYSGGYDVPPRTLTTSVREDMLFVEEVIGAGETAISDARGSQPNVDALARLVADAYVGGLLTGKAGVTHFHLGPGARALEPIHRLLDEHEVRPESLYVTHVGRTAQTMREAVALSRRGVTIDLDVMDGRLAEWLRYATEHGAELGNVTATSDAALVPPALLWAEVRRAIREGADVAVALALVTANPARTLKLRDRGRIAVGMRADVVLVDRDTWDVRHVFLGGRHALCDGAIAYADLPRPASRRTR